MFSSPLLQDGRARLKPRGQLPGVFPLQLSVPKKGLWDLPPAGLFPVEERAELSCPGAGCRADLWGGNVGFRGLG